MERIGVRNAQIRTGTSMAIWLPWAKIVVCILEKLNEVVVIKNLLVAAGMIATLGISEVSSAKNWNTKSDRTRYDNCKQRNFDGPGPGQTAGFLIDYKTCYVGSDVYTNEGVTKAECEHGIDIGNELFLDVIAAAPGKIIELIRDDDSEESIKRGALVYIKHGKFASGYHHLENIPKNLQEGDVVARGQKIGEVGLSGNTRRPHLHFTTHKLGFNNSIGKFEFTHKHWAVSAEDVKSKRITVPFFQKSKTYPDDKLTFPMSLEDCSDQTWDLTQHPTKPWRGR